MKELSKTKTDKFDKILKAKGGMNKEIKAEKISKEEKVEMKSHAIKEAVQIKKYVRN